MNSEQEARFWGFHAAFYCKRKFHQISAKISDCTLMVHNEFIPQKMLSFDAKPI
jgi:hypothetical protein